VLVDAAPLGGEDSARTVIAAYAAEIVHVEAADDGVLIDMDRAEDYQRCLARYRRR
jgi:CTP:molybdopterin cytidylyltransferase MocA